ncbi:MAG: hypothetical protein ACOYKZ_06780 [Chlamydiia bacterium]
MSISARLTGLQISQASAISSEVAPGALPVASTGFDAVTVRMSTDERAAALTQVAETMKAAQFETRAGELLRSLEEGNWETSIMQEASLPYLALALLHRGDITPMAFDTIQNYWACREACHDRHLTLKIVPLFLSNGEANPAARDLVLKTMDYRSYVPGMTKRDIWATDAQVDELFIQAAEQLKHYAKALFVFEDREFYEFSPLGGYNNSIGQTIYMTGHRILMCPRQDESDPTVLRMQASLELDWMCRKIVCGQDAVTPVPVLVPSGASPEEAFIEGSMTRARDQYTPFPGSRAPFRTDHYRTCPNNDSEADAQLAFAQHDRYHLSQASCICPSITNAAVQVGIELRTPTAPDASGKSVTKYSHVVGNQLIDMDGGISMSTFKTRHGLSDDDMGWMYLHDILNVAQAVLAVEAEGGEGSNSLETLEKIGNMVMNGPNPETISIARRMTQVVHERRLFRSGPEKVCEIACKEAQKAVAEQIAQIVAEVPTPLLGSLLLELEPVLRQGLEYRLMPFLTMATTWGELEQQAADSKAGSTSA